MEETSPPCELLEAEAGGPAPDEVRESSRATAKLRMALPPCPNKATAVRKDTSCPGGARGTQGPRHELSPERGPQTLSQKARSDPAFQPRVPVPKPGGTQVSGGCFFLPQGLCMCCSRCLKKSFPLYVVNVQSAFWDHLNCHFFWEALPN